ncbi:hypothetical protein QTP86_010275 [Hemibagrus guttatus]|nr:hypothetical protein QTP86_010275 [Hemibagrus guttatus]
MVTGGFVQMLRKRKELIPLIGFMAFAATGATSACIYFLFTKSDVILNKTSDPEPWERLDPTKAQKQAAPLLLHYVYLKGDSVKLCTDH